MLSGKSRPMPAQTRRLTAAPGVSHTPRMPVVFHILYPFLCYERKVWLDLELSDWFGGFLFSCLGRWGILNTFAILLG